MRTCLSTGASGTKTATSRSAWSHGSNNGCNRPGRSSARERETSTRPSSRPLEPAAYQSHQGPIHLGHELACASRRISHETRSRDSSRIRGFPNGLPRRGKEQPLTVELIRGTDDQPGPFGRADHPTALGLPWLRDVFDGTFYLVEELPPFSPGVLSAVPRAIWVARGPRPLGFVGLSRDDPAFAEIA